MQPHIKLRRAVADLRAVPFQPDRPGAMRALTFGLAKQPPAFESIIESAAYLLLRHRVMLIELIGKRQELRVRVGVPLLSGGRAHGRTPALSATISASVRMRLAMSMLPISTYCSAR